MKDSGDAEIERKWWFNALPCNTRGFWGHWLTEEN